MIRQECDPVNRQIIKVIPMKSVNGAAFGCSREELRALFGEPDCSFLKDPDDAVDTDDYGTFHVFYDDGYRFEALEVVACDEAEIFYDGERLPETYSEVLEFFDVIGGSLFEFGVHLRQDSSRTASHCRH